MMESHVPRAPIPRAKQNDYTEEAANQRRAFAEQHTEVHLDHVAPDSLDPGLLPGSTVRGTLALGARRTADPSRWSG
jgi:hypothetical protein